MLVKNHSRAQARSSLYDLNKFLSRAALLGIAPIGLVTYSREAIKNPCGYGQIRCTSTSVPSFIILSAVVFF